MMLHANELRRCEACAALVVWARTSGGMLMPVDAKPDELGRLRLTRLLSGELVVSVAGDPGEGLRRAHFRTCPDRESWRRRLAPTMEVRA